MGFIFKSFWDTGASSPISLQPLTRDFLEKPTLWLKWCFASTTSPSLGLDSPVGGDLTGMPFSAAHGLPFPIPSPRHGHPHPFLRITGSTMVHLTWGARREAHSGASGESTGTWNARIGSSGGEGDVGRHPYTVLRRMLRRRGPDCSLRGPFPRVVAATSNLEA